MCDVVFEEAKIRGATVNRRSVLHKPPSEGFFKKDFMRKFAEFTTKHL